MEQKIKILYIEHLRKAADIIETKLKDANMQFESLLVYTKEDFITTLKKVLPDIVLADNYFSAFNTTEALNIIRKNVTSIPFILISAVVSEEFIEGIINTEASGHLSKDHLGLLPEAIFNSPGNNIVIERLKLPGSLLSDNIVLRQEKNIVAETPLYDLSLLEEMDDTDYIIEIVSIFLNESPKELSEIRKAYNCNNADMINKQAHKFKGSAGLIQATQLIDILMQIEQVTKQGIITDPLFKLIENVQEHYKKIETALKKRLTQIRQQA